jgi:hypothetical protein
LPPVTVQDEAGPATGGLVSAHVSDTRVKPGVGCSSKSHESPAARTKDADAGALSLCGVRKKSLVVV